MFYREYLSSKEAANVKLQFDNFIADIVKRNRNSFIEFEVARQRLDDFDGKYLHRNGKYAALWKVMVFVFTFSREQSQVERGFNINSDILVENLKTKSFGYDFIKSSVKKIYEIEMDPSLILCCKNAYRS